MASSVLGTVGQGKEGYWGRIFYRGSCRGLVLNYTVIKFYEEERDIYEKESPNSHDVDGSYVLFSLWERYRNTD